MAAEWLRSGEAYCVLISLGSLFAAFRCLHAGASDGGFPSDVIDYLTVEVRMGEPLARGFRAGRAGGIKVEEISTVVIGRGKVGVEVEGLVSVGGWFGWWCGVAVK